MKKHLILCLLAVAPLFASAQNEQILIKDFIKDAGNGLSSFLLNDHVNVMVIYMQLKNMDLIVVDERM